MFVFPAALHFGAVCREAAWLIACFECRFDALPLFLFPLELRWAFVCLFVATSRRSDHVRFAFQWPRRLQWGAATFWISAARMPDCLVLCGGSDFMHCVAEAGRERLGPPKRSGTGAVVAEGRGAAVRLMSREIPERLLHHLVLACPRVFVFRTRVVFERRTLASWIAVVAEAGCGLLDVEVERKVFGRGLCRLGKRRMVWPSVCFGLADRPREGARFPRWLRRNMRRCWFGACVRRCLRRAFLRLDREPAPVAGCVQH